MKRNVRLEDISDGRLYDANDMVKADCRGCDGCSACCRDMGNSLVLDPLDIWQLCVNLKKTFMELLNDAVALNVVDGIILPNIKMDNERQSCSFLDAQGRCSIHAFRPGICRLFPLGRVYENNSFKYFLQVHECAKENKSKVKVRQWLNIPDLKRYEQFVTTWHYFLNDMEAVIADLQDEAQVKSLNMLILNTFYIQPYDVEEDFYLQFENRIALVKDYMHKGM